MLGHIVCSDGILPGPYKRRAAAEYPSPCKGKHLRPFLNLGAYFVTFIPGLSHVAEPLKQLLRGDLAFT